MGKPTKFTFNSGDNIPADSFNTIDPDNIVSQSPAKLIGGSLGVGSLTNLTNLGAGANDGAFKITIDGTEYDNVNVDLSSVVDEDDVANAIQTAIRTATGKNEVVVWDTDHYEITSSISNRTESEVLKLQAPTTGTDISVGSYLNLGYNATEVAGDGDDYKLVRLDENGQIKKEYLDEVKTVTETYPSVIDHTSSRTDSSSTSHSPSLPTNFSVGDLLIIIASIDGSSTTFSARADWTLIANTARDAVFFKVADSGDISSMTGLIYTDSSREGLFVSISISGHDCKTSDDTSIGGGGSLSYTSKFGVWASKWMAVQCFRAVSGANPTSPPSGYSNLIFYKSASVNDRAIAVAFKDDKILSESRGLFSGTNITTDRTDMTCAIKGDTRPDIFR